MREGIEDLEMRWTDGEEEGAGAEGLGGTNLCFVLSGIPITYSVITDNLRPRSKCSVRRTGILLVILMHIKIKL